MTTQIQICPNCETPLKPGARRCASCKLEVANMRAFAAAKSAAKRKGLATTQVESNDRGTPIYRQFLRPIVIVPLVLVALLAIYFTRPSPAPAWTRLPTSPTNAAEELLRNISVGSDAGYDRAYALIAPTAKNPENRDDIGRYRQLFHVLNNYLRIEFGTDWITQLSLQVDKNNSDLVAAHIGPETLHLRTLLQTPPEKLTDKNRHYAVEGIDEFSVADAAEMQKMAAITGGLGGVAGQGAVTNLQTILGAGGGNRRETPMQKKLRILPNLRDPRAAVRRTVLHTWPIRQDPVIRARLQAIVNDGRYASDVIATAQQVLQENVPEEELIAAGVN
jgi:hypothetical protein